MKPNDVLALTLSCAVLDPAAVLAQAPGTMTIPRPQGSTQCDSGSMLPGTIAGRLGGDLSEAERTRLLIVPASRAAEFYFTSLSQVTHGATPSPQLPFDATSASSVAAYGTQVREMRAQMRIVTISGGRSFRCSGFGPGRYLVVVQVVDGGRQSFYKSYATVPSPRYPGQRFVVNPTQPEPLSQ